MAPDGQPPGATRSVSTPRWSRFRCHSKGRADGLLAPVVPYEALPAVPAARRRRWSAYDHQTPDETELAAIRRSNATGLPYGEDPWVQRLCRRLQLDLTISPRGRPRKGPVDPK